jgi:hypothetical protein
VEGSEQEEGKGHLRGENRLRQPFLSPFSSPDHDLTLMLIPNPISSPNAPSAMGGERGSVEGVSALVSRMSRGC